MRGYKNDAIFDWVQKDLIKWDPDQTKEYAAAE